MRDHVTIADRVSRDLAAVDWPAPSEIRARAHRRAVAVRVTATVAVLVVALASALVALVGPRERHLPQPATPKPATPTVTRKEILPDALLQPQDVGLPPGPRPQEGLPVQVSYLLIGLACPAHQDRDVRPVRDVVARSQQFRAAGSFDTVVVETVSRWPGEHAERTMEDYRRILRSCAHYTTTSTPGDVDQILEGESEHTWTLVDQGFAGDESMIYRHDFTGRVRSTGRAVRGTRFLAMVRVGDLVAVLSGARGADERTRLRELTERAATKLCSAANPPC